MSMKTFAINNAIKNKGNVFLTKYDDFFAVEFQDQEMGMTLSVCETVEEAESIFNECINNQNYLLERMS